MGKLIVFEGLDGSGKATQTMLFHNCLNSLGIQHKIISFPEYNSPSSALLKMYLHGDFGTATRILHLPSILPIVTMDTRRRNGENSMRMEVP